MKKTIQWVLKTSHFKFRESPLFQDLKFAATTKSQKQPKCLREEGCGPHWEETEDGQRAFGCGFLLWLSWPWLLAFLQVLSQCPVFWLFILQTAQTGSLSLVSVPGYLVLPHFQPSWPLRERRVDGDHGSSEDMSASQHCSLASNHSLIYFFLNFIFYFGCAGSSLQHTCSRMHGLSSCGMGT